jgi:hypothetical protein
MAYTPLRYSIQHYRRFITTANRSEGTLTAFVSDCLINMPASGEEGTIACKN